MTKIKTREVTPLLYKIRTFLMGRPHNPYLRFRQDLSPRPAGVPRLPDGPAAALSANRYFARDARRMALPHQDVVVAQKMLPSGEGAVKVAEAKSGEWPPKPGKLYQPN